MKIIMMLIIFLSLFLFSFGLYLTLEKNNKKIGPTMVSLGSIVSALSFIIFAHLN